MSGGTKPLLLFFTCVRSGPCRRMESVLAQVGRKERERVAVIRIDIDEQPGAAAQFGVVETPALVLVRRRRVVARLHGRASATRIEALLHAHLEAPAAA